MPTDRDAVVKYALAQVGKRYEAVSPGYTATGPSAFDCSGLTMRALAQTGLEVPHNAGAQAQWFHDHPHHGLYHATMTTKRRLKPGDVVFWYGSSSVPESITHCGIFVGHSVLNGWSCVAAVDEHYGVLRHRMNWALLPSAFGFVRHA